jgi:pimeloyl-ACP methyl ester carboxylesterase
MDRLRVGLFLLGIFSCPSVIFAQEKSGPQSAEQAAEYESSDLEFNSHDGHEMLGRLILPRGEKPRAIVVYVQSAEGMTIDQKRPLRADQTFNYFDLYRTELTKRGIGFFSYNGRGIRMGDRPPRYETIDREVFNTSTLDNKVADVLSAIAEIKEQPGLAEVPIILMGASEGTLIAVEAASKDSAVKGLALYGVLASNMRENFAYILTDGDFLRYQPLDSDRNGSISKQEWENAVKGVGFDQADRNGDQVFTVDDLRVVNKPWLDALTNADFGTLNKWSQTSAGVTVPDKWFDDHFAHADFWSFLKGLKIPVGLFHGERDGMASVPALKEMEAKAKEANLDNVEFHYFDGLDHTLNIGEYFVTGKIPAGHEAIFEFIDRIAPGE